MNARRVTRIERQKNNPTRRNLYLDDAFALGISDETLLRSGLRVGDLLSEEAFRTLKHEEEYQEAKSAAMKFLSYRPRTEREVRDKLRETEHDGETIGAVVEGLKRSGLIDDRAFARMYIRDTRADRPVGPVLLKQKMLLLGLRREVIDEAIAEVLENVSQESDAEAAAEKFVQRAKKSGRTVAPESLRSRLSAHLARRGFAWDIVNNVVNKTLHQTDQSGESE
jgi:regulatory protein